MGLLNAPGGGEVKYANADKVETLDNGEVVLVFTNSATAEASFELPGTTKARILAVGGGGGGGGRNYFTFVEKIAKLRTSRKGENV